MRWRGLGILEVREGSSVSRRPPPLNVVLPVELIQLADVLLAALSYSIIPSPKLTSASSLALIEHCATGIKQNPKDKYGRDRLVVKHWVLPEDFRYH